MTLSPRPRETPVNDVKGQQRHEPTKTNRIVEDRIAEVKSNEVSKLKSRCMYSADQRKVKTNSWQWGSHGPDRPSCRTPERFRSWRLQAPLKTGVQVGLEKVDSLKDHIRSD